MPRRKMFGFNFVVVFFLICLFIYLPFFFFCLPIRLVYSPRFGGQKRPRGRRLRYEDRWLWSRARYLQEWLVCEDDKWCIANQVDGSGIVVSEGVLREEWCVSTSNIPKMLKGYVLILRQLIYCAIKRFFGAPRNSLQGLTVLAVKTIDVEI